MIETVEILRNSYRIVIDQQKKEIEILRELLTMAVRDYSGHKSLCNSQHGKPFPENLCDCGYTDYLNTYERYYQSFMEQEND